MILSPPKPASKLIARIRAGMNMYGPAIQAVLPERSDDFSAAVKRLGYAWRDRAWTRDFSFDVPLNDRMAELAHAIMLAGYAVEVPDEVGQLVIDEAFALEPVRFVKRLISGEDKDSFLITWRGRDDNAYNLANRLPTARWNGRGMVVRREFFEEILDFAALHGFEVSQGAKELAELAQAERDSAVIVDVRPIKKQAELERPELTVPDYVEIDRELLDDEYDDDVA